MSDKTNDSDISRMEKLHAIVWQLMNKAMSEGENPLTVAAILLSSSLTLYRSLLSETDYDTIIDHIIERKDSVIKMDLEQQQSIH